MSERRYSGRDVATFLVILALLAIGAWFIFRESPDAPAPVAGPLDPEIHGSADITERGVAAAPGASADALDREARQYIEDITRPEPMSVTDADDFVRADQVISLIPREAIESLTPRELLSAPGMRPESAITVVTEVEQMETATPAAIAEESGADLARRLRIVEDGDERDVTLRDVLDRYLESPSSPVTVVTPGGATETRTAEQVLEEGGLDFDRRLSVVIDEETREQTAREVLAGQAADASTPVQVKRTVEHYEVMTAEELRAATAAEPDKPIRVIKEAYGLDSTTVGELMMGAPGVDADTIFYLRTVQPEDKQGIWGIVHHGIIDNFARGVAIRRGESLQTYQVAIPRHADEMLNGQTSSFLGRLIHAKTRDTYVYNFSRGRMGRNPDLIHPGQEIVIVRFPPDELIAIYKEFVAQE